MTDDADDDIERPSLEPGIEDFLRDGDEHAVFMEVIDRCNGGKCDVADGVAAADVYLKASNDWGSILKILRRDYCWTYPRIADWFEARGYGEVAADLRTKGW